MEIEKGYSTSEFRNITLWVRVCAFFVFSQAVFIVWSLVREIEFPYWTSIVFSAAILIWIGYVAIEYSKERLAYKVHMFAQGATTESNAATETTTQNPQARPDWRAHRPDEY